MPQEPVKPDWEEQGGGQGPRGVGGRGWKGLGTAAEHGCPSGERGAAGLWGWGRAERWGEPEGDGLWGERLWGGLCVWLGAEPAASGVGAPRSRLQNTTWVSEVGLALCRAAVGAAPPLLSPCAPPPGCVTEPA